MISEVYRVCSKCGKIMSEGYYDDGDYYCSDECLPYSESEWDKYCEDYEDACFYTDWEPSEQDKNQLSALQDLIECLYDYDANGLYSEWIDELLNDETTIEEIIAKGKGIVEMWKEEFDTDCIDIVRALKRLETI